MFKKVMARLVGRLLDRIGTEELVRVWETIVHGLAGDWGFYPRAIESYDMAKNFGPFAIGMYKIEQAACEGLHSDYHDLYISSGDRKWGYEVFEGTGHLYKLDTGAF